MSEGNEQAFTDLFNRYRNKIFTVAVRLTASETIAEEIVQDVFLKVWMKRRSLKEIIDFDSWLFILTRNKVYSVLRTKARRELMQVPVSDELEAIAEAADTIVHAKEFQQLLAEAVDQLPVQQKKVYRLSRDEGYSHEAIGKELGITAETVRKHSQYALRSIRAYLLVRMDLGLLILLLWKNS